MTRRVTTLLFLLPVLLCARASAQTADELINKNIAAHGGLEKIKAVKTMKLTGKVLVDGVDIPCTLQLKRPNLVYGEAAIQGMKLMLGYDGQTAWQVDPSSGSMEPQPSVDEDARHIIEMGDFEGPLVDYKAKGNSVELVGKEEFEATPVYKLKVTEKDGSVKYVYLDAATYLELKTTTRRKSDSGGSEEETTFSDYKPVGGLLMAHSIETKINGQIEDQLTIEKVELNAAVDDSIFKMPKKAQGTKPPLR